MLAERDALTAFRGLPARRLADADLSALWQVATSVFQATANIPTVIWWNNFERIFMAVDDLGAGSCSGEDKERGIPCHGSVRNGRREAAAGE